MTIRKKLLMLFSLFAFNVNATVITLEDDPSVTTNGLEGVEDASAPLGDGAWAAKNDEGKAFQWIYWDDDGSDFLLGDLLSLSFDTKKPIGGPANDFYISIYTIANGVNDGAGWYGQRLNFDPFYAESINAPADTWNTWSTDTGDNQLRIYDWQNFGGYAAPFLSDLLSDTYADDEFYTFADIDYSQEMIRGIAFSTGSAWADTFSGSIDNIELTFSDQRVMTFDLEPSAVPEPKTMVMMILGLMLLAARRYTA